MKWAQLWGVGCIPNRKRPHGLFMTPIVSKNFHKWFTLFLFCAEWHVFGQNWFGDVDLDLSTDIETISKTTCLDSRNPKIYISNLKLTYSVRSITFSINNIWEEKKPKMAYLPFLFWPADNSLYYWSAD